jgi:uncharacterized protein YbbK (DUF523 family)
MSQILVSSCLLGLPARFDGTSKLVSDPLWEQWRTEGRLVPFCPELAAGATVPRPPAEIAGASAGEILDRTDPAAGPRVVEPDGTDVTELYVRGAVLTLEFARQRGITIAVLCDRSPSCASTVRHDGTFTRQLVPGRGITAEVLTRGGVAVFNQFQLDQVSQLLA